MTQSCTADGLQTQRPCANLQYGEGRPVDCSKMVAASTFTFIFMHLADTFIHSDL